LIPSSWGEGKLGEVAQGEVFIEENFRLALRVQVKVDETTAFVKSDRERG
jgi:hypothetical protein